MISKDWGNFKIASAAGAAVVAAGFAMFCSSLCFTTMGDLLKPTSVSVDLDAVSWLSAVKFRLETPTITEEPAAPTVANLIQQATSSEVAAPAAVLAVEPVRPKAAVRHARRHTHQPALVAAKAVVDQIPSTQAQGALAYVADDVNTLRFEELDIHLTRQEMESSLMVARARLEQKEQRRQVEPEQTDEAASLVVAESPSDETPAKAEPAAPAVSLVPSILDQVPDTEKKPGLENLTSKATDPLAAQALSLAVQLDYPVSNPKVHDTQTDRIEPRGERLSSQPQGPPEQETAPNQQQTATNQGAAEMAAPSSIQGPSVSDNSSDEYSQEKAVSTQDQVRYGYSAPLQQKSIQSKETQGAVVVAKNNPIITTPNPKQPEQKSGPTSSTMSMMSVGGSGSGDEAANWCGQRFAVDSMAAVEAFDWKISLGKVGSEVLSHEGNECVGHGRWLRSYTTDHWTTLHWANGVDETVPLLGHNTALLIAQYAGVKIQNGTGLVFGKAPAGWKIMISGRAERPLYFDSSRGVLNADDLSSDRYFVFLNAEPGSHLLYLTKGDAQDHPATIAFPVIDSHATYLEPQAPKSLTIRGKMLDGASVSKRGMKEVALQVVGQAGRSALTRAGGEFEIGDVYFSGNYPVYLEGWSSRPSKQGLPHRYRISADQAGSVELYQFPIEQLVGWSNQLEGGVSPDAGFALGAFPALVNQNLETPLFASMRMPSTGGSLVPVTFTVDEEDYLRANEAIQPGSPRVFSADLPDGVTLLQLEDKDGKVRWSQILFNSPRKINVIGPN